MKKILIFLCIAFIESAGLKHSDLCFPKQGTEFACFGNNSYNCGDFVCSRSQYSCHILSLFSVQNGKKLKYSIFINRIIDCPEPPKYKWNKNDVCLNSNKCVALYAALILNIYFISFI